MFISFSEFFPFVFCHVCSRRSFFWSMFCKSVVMSDARAQIARCPKAVVHFLFFCPGSQLPLREAFVMEISSSISVFFSLPPNFATCPSAEKVNYLASLLEGLARGTAEQFSVVHQRIASRFPSVLLPCFRTQVRLSVKAFKCIGRRSSKRNR